MKRFSMACLIALAPAAVMANITPTGTTITGGPGDYTWSYSLQLSGDHRITSGLPPVASTVAHDNLRFASFLTIYDFAGYIPGSCNGPTGWVCMVRNVGFTPDDVLPADNPVLPNLTFVYLTGPARSGQPTGIDLGTFSARSLYGTVSRVSYSSRSVKNSGSQAGSIADNVGSTQAPVVAANLIPEPSAAALAGLGLLMLGWSSRKQRGAARPI